MLLRTSQVYSAGASSLSGRTWTCPLAMGSFQATGGGSRAAEHEEFGRMLATVGEGGRLALQRKRSFWPLRLQVVLGSVLGGTEAEPGPPERV